MKHTTSVYKTCITAHHSSHFPNSRRCTTKLSSCSTSSSSHNLASRLTKCSVTLITFPMWSRKIPSGGFRDWTSTKVLMLWSQRVPRYPSVKAAATSNKVIPTSTTFTTSTSLTSSCCIHVILYIYSSQSTNLHLFTKDPRSVIFSLLWSCLSSFKIWVHYVLDFHNV